MRYLIASLIILITSVFVYTDCCDLRKKIALAIYSDFAKELQDKNKKIEEVWEKIDSYKKKLEKRIKDLYKGE